MITTILSDFSRVILFPKNRDYKGALNGLYKELQEKNIQYNFFDYFEFNEELLDLYTKLRKRYSINIFTTGIIQKAPEVKQRIGAIFDNVFSAEEYGLNKQKPESYTFIAEKLGKKPQEILYIDDEQKNIDVAKKAGLRIIHFEKNQKPFREIKQKFNLYR